MKRGILFLIFLIGAITITHAQPLNPAPANLPVKLISFKASVVNGSTNLTWQTAAEINSKEFVVEHSVEGTQWTKVGVVNAAGNSSVTQQYAFTHTQPAEGLNLYRLRTIDFDGSSELSTTLRVAINNALVSGIRLYPIPVSDHLIVDLTEFKESFTYTIIDANGRELKRGIVTRNKQRIGLQELKPGVYFFKTEQSGAIRFVK
ncbi:T9SS type A sorting domain-containing protein [Parasegetibacter sp. NRK P23]|uniref:T9SS type A sorting domain-containing protein n=1 Tax=Parasegetibacter sp. NRK P23 TaxID=2942999 RepID=UPI0020437219|nr:T9SS type A sorting domain-containing protein [Parasegetibacter sp. NRK P23]MCM5529291.1 T9SS type A sorting domain-containing protein [Parasegetibacter sp. NRK P23]